jgi:uncharacterized protein (DUF2164 family)
MIRKWDTKNEQLNAKCLNEVIARVQEIDDPSGVGIIAAQDIVDIVLENMGPEIYNKALSDAAKIVDDKVQDIEYSIDELKQS